MDNDDLDFNKLTEIIIQNEEEEEAKKERFKTKRDPVSTVTTVFSLVALGILIVVWVLLEAASPEREMRFITSFFDVQFGTAPAVRTRWNYALVYTAYVLQLISIGVCLIAFVVNYSKVKTKGGKLRISIFVIGGIAIIAFVFFLLRFGNVIF